MNGWAKVLAYTLITLFLGFILREVGFKGSRLVVLVGTVSLLGASALCIGEVMSALPAINGADKEYAVAMLKMVGACYAFGVSADVCRELGEGSLSDAVCLFGRIEILMISLPFIKRIVEKGIELI